MTVKSRASERGTSLVEAALIIPVLILFLACVVDLGRVYFAYIAIIDGAREGARYGAKHPTDATRVADIRSAVKAETASIVTLADSNIDVVSTWAQGSFVRVRVHIDAFSLILGRLFGRPTVSIEYSVAFRIRCEVDTGC